MKVRWNKERKFESKKKERKKKEKSKLRKKNWKKERNIERSFLYLYSRFFYSFLHYLNYIESPTDGIRIDRPFVGFLKNRIHFIWVKNVI